MAQTVSMTCHASRLREPLRGAATSFLMDANSTEGTIPRREERQSGKTDEMTVENVIWSHKGAVRI